MEEDPRVLPLVEALRAFYPEARANVVHESNGEPSNLVIEVPKVRVWVLPLSELGLVRVQFELPEAVEEKSPVDESSQSEEESPWYFVQGVRYCKVCRTRRCEKQVGGYLKCPPEET
jgi:hypothetical protein